MVIEALTWFWNTQRPREGWLAPLLLAAAIGALIGGVLAVGWVPEDGVVVPTAVLGLLLGAGLAKRPLSTLAAWTFILLYGLLITVIYLAQLWPPFDVAWRGWAALREYWLQNGALYFDRTASWFEAVSSGGSSDETIVFATLMGLIAWFLAAYVGWSAFRQRRPLLGLTLMGLVVAINGYYGAAPIYWAAAFVGVAVLITAVLHFANLEFEWQAHGVDYSREIRVELVLFAGGIGLALLLLALLLPAFSITRLRQAFVRQPVVTQAEETLRRVFAGVQPPRNPDLAPGRSVGGGLLPRSYLLGVPPEEQQTVVMLAEVSPEGQVARHWRAQSYDVYTGRGWALSDERRATLAPDAPIPLPPAAGQTVITQTVEWVFDEREIRYTLGFPLRLDQQVVTTWRGLTDYVRAEGSGSRYQVTSQLTTAGPDTLRTATLEAVPPVIIARYTNLPDDLPQRVRDLAQEVAGDAPTPYDQALALERFLHQYEYSLEVPLPPPGADPVDYFLFDLQQGYCDYYASTMVVLARSLGLPARLAVGYLAQPADARGVQTVRQINAHSWAEVYFAGYGWVEFEPTAPFAVPAEPEATLLPGAPPTFEAPGLEQPPIPERAPQRPFPWRPVLAVLVLAAVLGVVVVRQRRKRQPWDDVQWAYGRLQHSAHKLGQPVAASQTPDEFGRDLQRRLDAFATRPHLQRLTDDLRAPITTLTHSFIEHQYGPHKEGRRETAVAAWNHLRPRLWLLRLLRRLRRG